MPELTMVQEEKVQEWLKAHPLKCAACGGAIFRFGPIAAVSIMIGDGGLQWGPGSTIPLVPLICTACGLAQFVDAAAVGS